MGAGGWTDRYIEVSSHLLCCSPSHLHWFSEAMPPKSVPSAARPSVWQSQNWQSMQSKRLEAQRKELSATKPPTVEAFAAVVYMTADQVVPTNVETLRE